MAKVMGGWYAIRVVSVMRKCWKREYLNPGRQVIELREVAVNSSIACLLCGNTERKNIHHGSVCSVFWDSKTETGGNFLTQQRPPASQLL